MISIKLADYFQINRKNGGFLIEWMKNMKKIELFVQSNKFYEYWQSIIMSK